jgi:hypothetical protein
VFYKTCFYSLPSRWPVHLHVYQQRDQINDHLRKAMYSSSTIWFDSVNRHKKSSFPLIHNIYLSTYTFMAPYSCLRSKDNASVTLENYIRVK